MIENSNSLQALLRDVLLQSTAFLLAGLIVWRAVRQPARRHAVLVLALAGALVAPLASEIVRRGGWEQLAPLEVAATPPSAANVETPPASEPPRGERRPNPGHEIVLEPSDAKIRRGMDRRPSADALATAGVRPEPPASADASPRSMAGTNAGVGRFVPLLFAAAVALWGLASLVAAWRLIAGVLAGRRLVRNATLCREATVASALEAACARMGLEHADVDVYESSLVRCPMIWCWGRRPRLLLPADAVGQWSAGQWTLIFCHELAHWKRRDHWATLLAEVVCCLMPWQVLAWWTKHRLEHASEQACDDWAVASGHCPTDYAEMLLGLVAQSDPALALAAVRRSSGLAGRVRHILSQAVPRPRLGRLWATAVLCVAVGTIGVTALCQRGVARAESSAEAAPSEQVKSPEAKPSDGAADRADRLKRYTAHGKVVDDAGVPQPGVDVSWEVSYPPDSPERSWPAPHQVGRATTDPQGAFSIEASVDAPKAIVSQFIVRTARHGLRTFTAEPKKLDQPFEIVLEPAYSIEGTVFTPNGEPVNKARRWG